jgi:hypothetical protein
MSRLWISGYTFGRCYLLILKGWWSVNHNESMTGPRNSAETMNVDSPSSDSAGDGERQLSGAGLLTYCTMKQEIGTTASRWCAAKVVTGYTAVESSRLPL